MTFLFDRETALVPCGDGQYTIEASDVYRNPTGSAFGGWVAAIMARAVENHPERTSPIVSLQATYIAGVGPGEVGVEARLLKSGASTQFWRVELSQAGNLVIVGDIVTSNRRPVELNYQIEMPDIPAPGDNPELKPMEGQAPQWIRTYDQRIAKGVPFQVNETPESIVWIREEDGRPLDRISIISICDCPCRAPFSLAKSFARVPPSPCPPISLPVKRISPQPGQIIWSCGSPVPSSETARVIPASNYGQPLEPCWLPATRLGFSDSKRTTRACTAICLAFP